MGLDAGRLAATTVAGTTAGGVAAWVVLNPGQDPTELLAFMLAIGVVGAVVVLGADLTATVGPTGHRNRTHELTLDAAPLIA